MRRPTASLPRGPFGEHNVFAAFHDEYAYFRHACFAEFLAEESERMKREAESLRAESRDVANAARLRHREAIGFLRSIPAPRPV